MSEKLAYKGIFSSELMSLLCRRAESRSSNCRSLGASIHIVTDWVLASKVGDRHCRSEDDWGNAVHVFLRGDQHYC